MPNLHTLNPDEKFAQLSNESIDDLTLIGTGYLANLLRHEDGWVPSLDKLVQQKKAGRDTARKARLELLRKGYYVKVKFKYDGGPNVSDIWRAVRPFTNDDLDQIASYYRRGSTWQVPKEDAAGGHVRDSRGRTVMTPVVVTWASMESWRSSVEVVTDPVEANDETPGRDRGADSRPPGNDGTSPGGGFPTLRDQTVRIQTVGNPPLHEKTIQNPSENTTQNPTEPFGDPQKVPDLQKGYEEDAGHFGSGVTKQGDLVSNPLPARARTNAGPSACQVIDNDPFATQDELVKIIRSEQPSLSHGQAAGRAAMLIATKIQGAPSAPPAAS